MFKAQVLDLVVAWVEQERGVSARALSKESHAAYVGGLGEKGETPVLFVVDEQTLRGQERHDRGLSDPLDLINGGLDESDLEQTMRLTEKHSPVSNPVVEVGEEKKASDSISNTNSLPVQYYIVIGHEFY